MVSIVGGDVDSVEPKCRYEQTETEELIFIANHKYEYLKKRSKLGKADKTG